MKKRLFAVLLAAALLLSAFPAQALAAGLAYGNVPIYTGYADIDYMADEILKGIPTAGKSDTEKIRAVYDWIVKNCSRYDWNGTYYFDTEVVLAQAQGAYGEKLSAALESGGIVLRQDLAPETQYDPRYGMYVTAYDSNMYICSFAYDMMLTRTGTCAHFAALLSVLLGHLGYDCRLIDGDFINRDGSKVEHKWNYVLVNGRYYWLDPRMDHSAYASTGKINYQYFMKTDLKEWESRHEWDHTYSNWLASNAAQIAERYTAASAVAADGPWSRCSDWARDYMQRAGDAGLVPDRLSGTDLTATITRAEFASVALGLYQALTGEEAGAYTGETPFSDTADVDVLRAYSLGIVGGVGGGRFAPEENLTREQAVTMLGRVYELAETGAVGTGAALDHGAAQAFADDGMISAYARDYIYFFVGCGVIDGVGGNCFEPAGAMTREQALKVALLAADSL